MARRRRIFILQAEDGEIDLVPLIDCVFLILLFFMLCGHITVSERAEEITIPPARTAEKVSLESNWRHEIINLGGGHIGTPVRIRLGQSFDSRNLSEPESMRQLRALLDRLYDSSPAVYDPAHSHSQRKQVVIELRADGDVPWHTMQTVQQILADSIDPLTGLPNQSKTRRPFTELLFSARPTDG